MMGSGAVSRAAPDDGPSMVHGENRLHNEAEASQHAKQFAVTEGLASRGEARAPGRLLEQRVRGERLKQRCLLIVGVAVYYAVHPAEGSRGVDRIQGSVDPRVLPRRHLVLDAGGYRRQCRVLLLIWQSLDLLQCGPHDQRYTLHKLAVEHATQRLDVGHARVVLEPDWVRGATPRQGK